MTQRSTLLLLFLLGSWSAMGQDKISFTNALRTDRPDVPAIDRGGAPANDECDAVTPASLAAGSTITFNGDNTGATVDDPPVINGDQDELPAVWEAFTTTECMDVTIDFCGTVADGAVLEGLFAGCPQEFLGRPVSSENTTCVDGNFTLQYLQIPPGTYFIPVVIGIGSTPGAYTVNVTGTACSATPPGNDECDGAITLTVGVECASIPGSTLGATESQPADNCSGFVGVADDDVWFTFEATTTSQVIEVTGSDSFDAVLGLFEGDCGDLVLVGCVDNTLDGGVEIGQANGLVVGNTYFIRVYDWYLGQPGTSDFTICVFEGIPPPENDDCPGTLIPTALTCVEVEGTTEFASLGLEALECNATTGDASDDVWYSFVSTATTAEITVTGNGDFDAVVDLFSGECSALTPLACADEGLDGETETISVSDLTVGETYIIRLFDWFEEPADDPTFTICVVQDNTTGIVRASQTDRWSLLTDVATGALSLQDGKGTDHAVLTVFDGTGRLVAQQRMALGARSRTDLQFLQTLTTGAYVLRVQDDAEQAVIKFVR
ncbi:MAG: T9SS type A sorting domain-containing protein [Flavobacteriales bacterium]|nr:T9SS type A sorting domain-containing protein [Flavobacteriales bacterium]